jgi:hypothetical protein
VKLRMILGAAVLVIALALAPAATAQSSSVGTYGGNGGQVAGVAGGGESANNAVNTSNTAGSLPFTGMDVGLVVGGGVLLLLAGIGMARLTARSTNA